jgi:hypothetical protein
MTLATTLANACAGVIVFYQNTRGCKKPREFSSVSHVSLNPESHTLNVFIQFCKSRVTELIERSNDVRVTIGGPGDWNIHLKILNLALGRESSSLSSFKLEK